MATVRKGKSMVADHARHLIAGTGKHLGNVTQMTFLGSSFTAAEVTSKLGELVKLRDVVDAARAAAKAGLADEKAGLPALRIFMDAYVAYVKATFGSEPDVLADFGLLPKKARTPLTAEARAAAVAKGAATRLKRHTMGSKQKLAVKGDVIGITVTPVLATAPVAKAPSSPASGTTNPAAPSSPTLHTTT